MAKVWKVPQQPGINYKPFPLPVTHKHTPKQFYTLFKYDAFNKRYEQIGRPYANERIAWRVYRHKIGEAPLTYTIKPCKLTLNRAEGKTHFSKPHYNHAKEMIQSSAQELETLTSKRSQLEL